MIKTPDAHYRISTKALIQDKEWRVLFTYNIDHKRDLLWGWLDHGETPQEWLIREVYEESWLELEWVDEMPFYIDTCKTKRGTRRSNIYYKAKIKNLDILPTAECLEVRYLDKQQILDEPIYESLKKTMLHIYEKISQ